MAPWSCRRTSTPGVAALLLVGLSGCQPARQALEGGAGGRVEWPSYGGDAGGLKYSPARQITPGNVGSLRPLWEWRPGDTGPRLTDAGEPVAQGAFETTPVMLGDTLYFTTPFVGAVAVDAHSGAEIWRYESEAWRWGEPGGTLNFVHRGLAVWTGETGRRLLLPSRWRLVALDAATGRPVPGFGVDGIVDLSIDLRWPVNPRHLFNTSPPTVFQDIVIVGSAVSDALIHPRDPPGDVRAFDVRTGRLLWRWEPVPRAGQLGAETWDSTGRENTGHLNVWTPMTVDTARGLVYLPVSTPSNDWYGGQRPGDNLFAESLVCLDARTGRMVWYRQLVHHGLWDYDPPAPPNLVTIQQDGRQRDVVVLPGKTGFLYVFDRVSGEPVWPLEERPVPASDVPGEQAAPTQPFPAWPPPFSRQGVTPDDLVDFTPEIRALATAATSGYRFGPIFTPPSLEGTIVMPGWRGGAGWGGGAVDPEAQVIYVKASNLPTLGRLVPRAPDASGSPSTFVLDPDRPRLEIVAPGPRSWLPPFRRRPVYLPVLKPPYGTLTAIDLNSGEHRWQVPLGDEPAISQLRPRGYPDRGPVGTAGPAGGMVTAGGLVFITGGGSTLYAMNSRDGAVAWSWDLGARALSNPMTYQTAAGHQVVVVAVGAGAGIRLQAFALPR